jgi:hypothetical protein
MAGREARCAARNAPPTMRRCRRGAAASVAVGVMTRFSAHRRGVRLVGITEIQAAGPAIAHHCRSLPSE